MTVAKCLMWLVLILCNVILSSSECPSFEYTHCAVENTNCRMPAAGEYYMSYGASGRFSIEKVDVMVPQQTFLCTNEAFGSDPHYGHSKACCYAAGDFSGVSYEGLSWQYCADEGGYCGGLDSSTVYWIKYGSGSRYNYMLVQSYRDGSQHCSNTVFGDAYPGVPKKCYKAIPASMGYETELTLAPMECKEDGDYINNWDGYHNNIQLNYFVNGQQSYHDNHREDRRFKWRYCKPRGESNTFTSTGSLSQTGYDAEWTRSCYSRNGGHSAIIGGVSHHDNHREDRQWTFHCGDLDNSKYALINCGWTTNLNYYDGHVDYDCPDEKVVRSIWSKHDNHKEDRLWQFECCAIRNA